MNSSITKNYQQSKPQLAFGSIRLPIKSDVIVDHFNTFNRHGNVADLALKILPDSNESKTLMNKIRNSGYTAGLSRKERKKYLEIETQFIKYCNENQNNFKGKIKKAKKLGLFKILNDFHDNAKTISEKRFKNAVAKRNALDESVEELKTQLQNEIDRLKIAMAEKLHIKSLETFRAKEKVVNKLYY